MERDDAEALLEQVELYKMMLAERDEQLEDLQSQLAGAATRDRPSASSADVASLSEQLALTKLIVAEKAAALDDSQHEIDVLERTVEELRAGVAVADASLDESRELGDALVQTKLAMAEREEMLEERTNALSLERKRTRELESQVERVASEMSSMRSALDDAEAAADRLGGDENKLKLALDQAEMDVGRLAAEKRRLKEALEKTEAKLAKAEAKLDKRARKADKANNADGERVGDLQRQLEASEQRSEALAARLEAEQAERAALERRHGDDVRELRAQLAAAQAEARPAPAAPSRTSDEVGADVALARLEALCDALRADLQRARDGTSDEELAKVKDALVDTRAELAEALGQNQRLRMVRNNQAVQMNALRAQAVRLVRASAALSLATVNAP